MSTLQPARALTLFDTRDKKVGKITQHGQHGMLTLTQVCGPTMAVKDICSVVEKNEELLQLTQLWIMQPDHKNTHRSMIEKLYQYTSNQC